MYQYEVHPLLQAVLGRLGWAGAALARHSLSPYASLRSETEPSLYLRGRQTRTRLSSPSPTSKTVLLGCDHPDAFGDDAIPPVLIDVNSSPLWEHRVFRWHLKATLRLGTLCAKHAERNRRVARFDARRKAHAAELADPAGCLLPIGSALDGGYTGVRLNMSVYAEINASLGAVPTAEQSVERGRELLRLLRDHGFIRRSLASGPAG